MKAYRNVAAFWLAGFCNNFCYVVLLTGAQDILKRDDVSVEEETPDQCLASRDSFVCTPHSTGLILLFNILPGLTLKLIFPLFQHRIPYSVRQIFISVNLACSLIIIALSPSLFVSLIGIFFASISSGLGEASFLGLASHFDRYTVAAWSSGTGLCGVVGSLVYALVTDKRFLGLSPRIALLCTLVAPILYFITNLHSTPSLKESPVNAQNDLTNVPDRPKTDIEKFGAKQKMVATKSLLKYMIPLFVVYFAEYEINQGLLELTVFNCDRSFSSSPSAQYRWYQMGGELREFALSTVSLSDSLGILAAAVTAIPLHNYLCSVVFSKVS
ncbi:hypothetical protein WR25_07449 [Diploscapter pachys]|uniref:Battenin n=1 Tax=Diploscapter pachys TaxID=2018661 RepID=A0A2A2JT87_9BILA|nr:hypothetical protein WR25_07449 [Diploscapter pachys]